MSNDNLLPCPFCNGPAERLSGGEGDARRFATCCQDQTCPGNTMALIHTTADAADDAWNTRANDGLCTIDINIELNDDGPPINIQLHATNKMAARFEAYMKGQHRQVALLNWISEQDRLRIERWHHPGGKQSVSVYTALDDEDKPSGQGADTYEALEMAQAHQQSLINGG